MQCWEAIIWTPLKQKSVWYLLEVLSWFHDKFRYYIISLNLLKKCLSKIVLHNLRYWLIWPCCFKAKISPTLLKFLWNCALFSIWKFKILCNCLRYFIYNILATHLIFTFALKHRNNRLYTVSRHRQIYF